MRILSSVFVLCAFGIASASAAPSVKMLGANSARVGTNATVVKSSDSKVNSSTQRLGTIRSKAVNVGAPVTVNKVVSPSVATDSGSDARLSLGKYIHSTGVSAGTIKPVTNSASNAGTMSNDIIALSEQVKDLKQNKQDALNAGDGLALGENNTISLNIGKGLTLGENNTVSLNVGDGLVLDEGNTVSLDQTALQNQVTQNVNTALGDNYYTAEEVDELLGVTQTYASTTEGISDYNTINVADTFDENHFKSML